MNCIKCQGAKKILDYDGVNFKDGWLCPRCKCERSISQVIGFVTPAEMDFQEFMDLIEDNNRLAEQKDEFPATEEYGQVIRFNDERRQIWIQNGPFITLLDYDNIFDYDLLEDGSSRIGGTAGRALIGGMIGGNVGAIIGSSGSRKNIEYCNELQLKLTLKNGDVPAYYIDLIHNTLRKDSEAYRDAYRRAQNIVAKLRLILAEEPKSTQPAEEAAPSMDIPAEIRKYKSLFDDGIITEEEFTAKKNALLNL